MKNIAKLLLIATLPLSAMAEDVVYGEISSELPDSVLNEKAVNLDEVTVNATPVIRKADRDLFVISDELKKKSSDGLDLLKQVQIPSLTVNTVLEKVEKMGESVQLRINGRKVNINQIKALQPETIVRVEYHDNPGLRYKDAVAVLDFIVKNPNSGGVFYTNALQSITKGFGNHSLGLNLNYGYSQWEIEYSGNERLDFPMYREYSEKFNFSDGTKIIRKETPIGGSIDGYQARPRIGYSYVVPEKINFYTGISYNQDVKTSVEFNGLMSSSIEARNVVVRDYSSNPGKSPNLNLYLDKNIGRGQTIILDVNAGLYFGESIRNYRERYEDATEKLVYIDTRIKDRNFALTIEGDYVKEWKTSKLTTGVVYTGNWNRTTYLSQDGLQYNQRQDKIYFFGEWVKRINKFSLTVGMGGQYNNVLTKETNQRAEEFLLRPRLFLSYNINDKSVVRFNFNSYTTTPSLSQTSSVRQEVDGIQMQEGNPQLRPYNYYKFSFSYHYTHPRVQGSIQAYLTRGPHAIMDYRYIDGNNIVQSWSNNSGYTQWGISVSPRVVVLPDWVTLSGTIDFHRDYSRGVGYRHIFNGLSGNADINISHWGFSLQGQIFVGRATLWGEEITRGEKGNLIALSYRWNRFTFATGMLMPFGKYSNGTELRNRYVKIDRIGRTTALERMPFIQLSWNIDWGRKSQGLNKRINNSSGVQQSTSAGK